MRITVVGCGHTGLITAACLADLGHRVQCVDRDRARVAAIRAAQVPSREPGLVELFARNVIERRLAFHTDISRAVATAKVVFIAVGVRSSGSVRADPIHVCDVAREVAKAMRPRTVIVIKSTVPVGTGDQVERIISETRPGVAFSVASIPDFLRQGGAIAHFRRTDGLIIGTDDQTARRILTTVYRPLNPNPENIRFAGRRAIELVTDTLASCGIGQLEHGVTS